MAWRRPGDKPLSEPMMVRLLTHICFIRPQWVKSLHYPHFLCKIFTIFSMGLDWLAVAACQWCHCDLFISWQAIDKPLHLWGRHLSTITWPVCQYYRTISNIRRTKSPNLNVSHLVLKSALPNPLKPGVKSRMKMLLEQRRQAMLQLHLSDRQFNCLLRCILY